MGSYKDILKSQLGGLAPSTARSRLDRTIMLAMAKKLEQDYCFRCSKQIRTIDEFSVEHKIEWLHSENPVELYFDLDNIAFSHIKCNTGARRYTNSIPHNKGNITHGVSGYRLGCRCEICKSKYSLARKERYIRNKT